MFWLLFILWVALLMAPTIRLLPKELLLVTGLFLIVVNPPGG